MTKSLIKKGDLYLLIEEVKEVINELDNPVLLEKIACDLDSIISEMRKKI